jgi:hypothetical protein
MLMRIAATVLRYLLLPSFGLLLILAWRRRDLALIFLIAPIAYVLATHAVSTHFINRYLHPAVPLIVVSIGIAIEEVRAWSRSRDRATHPSDTN